eukprot:s182_g2.t1
MVVAIVMVVIVVVVIVMNVIVVVVVVVVVIVMVVIEVLVIVMVVIVMVVVVVVEFLGRQIFRQPGEKALSEGLPEDYLKTTFESYGLKSGSRTAPDVTPMLDQEGKELTPEAYSRFRSALGKLSWYAQTRQDIRAWIGFLAAQQAKPTDCTEEALKAVLNILMRIKGLCCGSLLRFRHVMGCRTPWHLPKKIVWYVFLMRLMHP